MPDRAIPTEPGWYWWRYRNADGTYDEWEAVQVGVPGQWCECVGSERPVTVDALSACGEWGGRIQEPEERQT